jgi:acyl-CoA dehydrogenase
MDFAIEAPEMVSPEPWTLADASRRCVMVARAHAVAVDREGRFPAEAVAALRRERLLGAFVPVSLGGAGATLSEIAGICYALGQACASTAMVFAMHQIQVACLARHGIRDEWHRRFLARVADGDVLLASITSEEQFDGAMRASRCALVRDRGTFTREKRATAISYGAFADAFLVTARAEGRADVSNQVLLVVERGHAELIRTGSWDAMGMRGTCTDSFVFRTRGSLDQVLAIPFARIAAETMVPVSHMLWSSLWAGIAADAVARARLFLRARMRGSDGATPVGAVSLMRAIETLHMVESRVKLALARFEGEGEAGCRGDTVEISSLKTGVSEACLDVVGQALRICGFAGYGNTGPYSVSRHLRDICSAALMVNNDRIRDDTARLMVLQSSALGIS